MLIILDVNVPFGTTKQYAARADDIAQIHPGRVKDTATIYMKNGDSVIVDQEWTTLVTAVNNCLQGK